MKSIYLSALVVIVTFASAAQGSNVRSFVESTGMDTNPCTRVAPCRSFGAAIAQTVSGGAVIALDSAGYGSVTISQSITLFAPEGVYAAMTAASGTVIAISGAATTDVVTLRGLSIEGVGTASNGVALATDNLNTLRIQNCSFSGFVTYGIDYTPNNTGSALYVSHSTFSDNGTAIFVFGASGLNPTVSIDHCEATGGANAYWITQAIALISNSLAAGGSNYGIIGQGGPTQLMIDHCEISRYQKGIASGLSALVCVSNTTVVNNTTGLLSFTSGNLLSLVGDVTYVVKTNAVVNNNTNGAFTGTFTAQ